MVPVPTLPCICSLLLWNELRRVPGSTYYPHNNNWYVIGRQRLYVLFADGILFSGRPAFWSHCMARAGIITILPGVLWGPFGGCGKIRNSCAHPNLPGTPTRGGWQRCSWRQEGCVALNSFPWVSLSWLRCSTGCAVVDPGTWLLQPARPLSGYECAGPKI